MHISLMSQQIHIFDRQQVRRQRDRAAALYVPRHSVLCEEVATHLVTRIGDVKRDFKTVLDLGAHDGLVAKALDKHKDRFVVASDLSQKLLQSGGGANLVVADEELLPFAHNSFDLVVSNLSLHWVNDLPGALVQIKNAMRPDGLFLATLLGGQTLYELRECLLEAELAICGGISPRMSPNIDMQTASALLQRAGFSLPVTDQELLTFTYTDMYALMRDVRGMGEANAHSGRLMKFTSRKVFEWAARLYKERFALPDGRIRATFDVIFMHGWS